MKLLQNLLRVSITLIALGLAAFFGMRLWTYYVQAPWTRDGRMQAYIVSVAPDVSGLVAQVSVHDNQVVHKGDLLFRIDADRYRLALAQANAVLKSRVADLAQKRRSAARRAQVDDLVVSGEVRELADTQVRAATALYEEAQAQVATARLDIARSEIRAPVDGYVTNLRVQAGDYAMAGRSQLAVVDRNSFWVYGYFEETKIPLLHENDPVQIKLMSGAQVLQGHIDSIARAIADRDNATTPELLANVNPTFAWVRLAQRIPVRIHIDSVPDKLLLIAGMTCTVVVNPQR